MDKRVTGSRLADTEKFLFSDRQNLPDYSAIRPVLPLREAHLTQTGPGHYSVSNSLLVLDDIAVARTCYTFPALAIFADYPGRLLFSLPLHWEGNLKINGHCAQPCQLHMADEDLCFHIAGGARETLNISVNRGLFLQTLAALAGYREEPALRKARELDIAPAAFARLRDAVLKALSPSHGGHPAYPGQVDATEMVFEALIDAYLSAQTAEGIIEHACRHPGRIVRAVEERFEQAMDQPLSLADLCRAAGVSKNTLYRAFHSHCDMSPLEFVHKRRLTTARTRLVMAQPARGLVKNAALTAGLPQLGRFSVEYRELFGELPSATLRGRPLAEPEIYD